MRIEKVGGNREGVAVDSNRQLCFSYEEKMRFSGGEMLFYRSSDNGQSDLDKFDSEAGRC